MPCPSLNREIDAKARRCWFDVHVYLNTPLSVTVPAQIFEDGYQAVLSCWYALVLFHRQIAAFFAQISDLQQLQHAHALALALALALDYIKSLYPFRLRFTRSDFSASGNSPSPLLASPNALPHAAPSCVPASAAASCFALFSYFSTIHWASSRAPVYVYIFGISAREKGRKSGNRASPVHSIGCYLLSGRGIPSTSVKKEEPKTRMKRKEKKKGRRRRRKPHTHVLPSNWSSLDHLHPNVN